jgi:hypothetical protein
MAPQTRIEAPGTFVFQADGKATFLFANKEVDFSSITTTDQLKAVLVAIAQHVTQLAFEAILKPPNAAQEAGQRGSPADAFRRAQEQMQSVLAQSEHAFTEHQRKTAEALQQAQKDYEAATANISHIAGRT